MGVVLIVGSVMQTALAQDATPTEGDQKVVFTWGTTGEPSSLNPMSGYLALDFYFWTGSYHLLTDFDQDLAAEPGLATKIDVSDDGMTFTYHIRDDITWSDGQPLTAEDVAYTLNLYKNNHAYLPQNYLTMIDGDVRVVDDFTVEFDSIHPTALYSGEVPYMYDYILPKHVLEGIEKPKQYENVPNVGSGPFIIDEYKVGEFVRMVRNPEWDGDEPYIDEIITRLYKNEDALAEAVKLGEVDFAYFTSANIFNSLQNQQNIETVAGTIPSFSEIGMNTGSAYQEPMGDFEPHGDGHEALTDVRVRQAIRMAINSEELTERVLLGYGVPGTTIVPPVSVEGARWVPEGDDLLAWDIDGANQLLDDAGYLDTDDDGVREMPGGGDPLIFRYYTLTSEQTSVDASTFVSEWLQEIGIQTKVEATSSGRLGDIINAGTYDIFSWGWIPDPDPDSALSWFLCEQRPPDGKEYGNNDSYYCNPEYDEMYDAQRAATDPEERWKIVHEMQKIYYEDAAYAVMWYDPIFQAYRSDRWDSSSFRPQPVDPPGDLLEGWGGPSEVWTTLRPVGVGGTTSAQTRGISPLVWLAIAIGIVLIVVAIVLSRRRAASDEDTA
jgi:peptide/nickel transport system substrate-binding protein